MEAWSFWGAGGSMLVTPKRGACVKGKLTTDRHSIPTTVLMPDLVALPDARNPGLDSATSHQSLLLFESEWVSVTFNQQIQTCELYKQTLPQPPKGLQTLEN